MHARRVRRPRHAARQVRRQQRFAVLVVLTLGSGIGAPGAIFAMVNATVLRPLPLKDADEVVWMWNARTERDRAPFTIAVPAGRAWRLRGRRTEDRPGSVVASLAMSQNDEPGWLLLAHRAPAGPSRARVAIWRRLQRIGAYPLKNAVYVLPDTSEAREDFEWVRAQLATLGGDAAVFAARCLDPTTREEIVAGMRSTRQQDYKEIRQQAVDITSRAGRRQSATSREKLRRDARKLRSRFGDVIATDFFGAPGREEARAAIDSLDRLLAGPHAAHEGSLDKSRYHGRLWLTRPQPGIDRMSSAWLIRRFIDPAARFAFGDRPSGPDAIPFDMFGVEFGHHGDACTFETLVSRFALTEPGLETLSHLVHDLDLKEDRYHVPEAPAIARLVDGLRRMYADDAELLERGMTMIEALYRSHTATMIAGAAPASPKRGRRRTARASRQKKPASDRATRTESAITSATAGRSAGSRRRR